MPDIISQIIKIDQQAGEKINELNQAKEQHRIDFEAQLQKSNHDLDRKAKERINSFAKTEQDFIQTQKEEMDKEIKLKIKKLEEKYEYNHDDIERKIFKSIIAPSV